MTTDKLKTHVARKVPVGATHGISDYSVIIVAFITLADKGIWFLVAGLVAALLFLYVTDDH